MVPLARSLSRADQHVELHDVSVASAQHSLPNRQRTRARRDVERNAVRDRPHYRLSARGAPAGGRVGAGTHGAGAVSGWPGGSGTRVTPRVVATDLDGTIVR